jgi:hypothetical protein
MIEQLDGLINTGDLSQWENQFVTNLVLRTVHGRDTTTLTEKQIERLQELYCKHFADAEPA